MKALVIGYGSIGKRHIENISKFLKMQCIVLTKRKNDSFLKKNNCIIVRNLKDGVKLKPDFALITNESHLHLSTAIKLANSNIPFFIEKPLSNNLKNVEKLLKLVKKKNIITMVGCNLRFHPCFIKMKHIILQKKLGKILSIKSENSSYLPNWHPLENYQKSYAAQKNSGGVVHTCIHEIDYLSWIFGKINSVMSITGKFSNLSLNTDDLSATLFKFRNNGIGELHLDFFSQPNFRTCRIVGTKGTLSLDYLNSELNFFEFRSNKWKKLINMKNYDQNLMYVDELKHFCECISKNKKTINPVDEHYDILKVTDAILKSSKTKKMVTLR